MIRLNRYCFLIVSFFAGLMMLLFFGRYNFINAQTCSNATIAHWECVKKYDLALKKDYCQYSSTGTGSFACSVSGGSCKTNANVCTASSGSCVSSVPDASGNCPSSCSKQSCDSSGGSGDACGDAGGECSCTCSVNNRISGVSCTDGVACGTRYCCSGGGGGAPPGPETCPSGNNAPDCSKESESLCQGKSRGDPCNGAGSTYACEMTLPSAGGANDGEDGLELCQCIVWPICNPCVPTAPSAPTLNSPANNYESPTTTVTLSWNAVNTWGSDCNASGADRYYVYVGTSSSPTTLVASPSHPTLTFDYEAEVGVTYYWRVRSFNGAIFSTSYSATRSFTTAGSIAGQVQLDDAGAATLVGGFCQLGGASGVEPGAGSQAIADSLYAATVDGSGNYSISGVPSGSGHTVTLVPGDANYRCTCPDGCVYGGIDTGTTGLDFFVTRIADPWWQVTGGSLHADLGNVTSYIPSSCSGACSPYLVLADGSGDAGLVSYSGSLSLGDVGEENISETGDNWFAQTQYQGLQTGYNYFVRILEEDPEGFFGWDGSEPLVSGVYESVGVNVISGGDWSIGSGTQAVMLVEGDMVVDVNIDVAEGGFLAIVASGNIFFGDNVTNVEGVFIADGAIVTCESATCGSAGVGEQFTGEGIFVGWGGIDLRRDFDGSDNDIYPAEHFVYRSDLQVNAYNYLLLPRYTWQEVAP